MLVSETVGNGWQRSDGNAHFEVASEAGSALSRTASWVCFGKRLLLLAVARLRGTPGRDGCQRALWDCLGDAFLTWRKIRPPMHFDNHLDLVVSCQPQSGE